MAEQDTAKQPGGARRPQRADAQGTQGAGMGNETGQTGQQQPPAAPPVAVTAQAAPGSNPGAAPPSNTPPAGSGGAASPPTTPVARGSGPPPSPPGRGSDLRVTALGLPPPSLTSPTAGDYKYLQGVTVTATDKVSHTTGASGMTDANGIAHLKNLQAGTYDVSASTPAGYQPAEPLQVTIEANVDTERVIGFAPLSAVPAPPTMVTVSGKAVDSAGVGLAGVKVQAVAAHTGAVIEQAHTGADGAFALSKVPLGEKTWIRYDTRHTLPDQTTLLLRRGERVQLQPTRAATVLADVVYESAGCQISGTVVYEVVRDGQTRFEPLPNVKVRLEDDDHAALGEATSDGQGDFCFRTSIAEEGGYTLIFPAQLASGQNTLSLADPTIDIHLQPPRPFVLFAPVRYQLAAGQVLGQITDAARVGLDRVRVELLNQTTGDRRTETTDAAGYYRFGNVAPGTIVVSFNSSVTDSKGDAWQLRSDQPSRQSFSLTAGHIKYVDPVVYEPEQHIINYSVVSNGGPAGGILVELRKVDGADGKPRLLDRAVTRPDDGGVTFEVEEAGTYQLWTYPPSQFGTAVVVNQAGADPFIEDVVVNSVVNLTRTINAAVPGAAPSFALNQGNGDLKESVVDLAAYPILTEEVSSAGGPPGGAPAGAGGAPLGQIVDRELRAVLGWRTKVDDPKGFVAALNQSFAPKTSEGLTTWTWVPRSYAVTVDAGAITGAQASIWSRARAALDQSLPLLDGLRALDPAADAQNVEAIRSIVRSEFQELVYELGQQGGPTTQRVDSLFSLLLEIDSNLGQAALVTGETVRGTLGQLRDVFGLTRRRVNTIDEEQNLTNFFIVVDYITSLQQSWVSQRTFFDHAGANPFFGTQTVLLTRQLAVVAESVQEVMFAMDSVFLREGERATIALDVPGGPPVFVGELLAWTRRWAGEEAPRLVEEGGVLGVSRLFPTVITLRDLVRGGLVQNQPGNTLPAGYRTSRVQRALSELADQLDETASLARSFQNARPPVNP